jgi:hypothetical protein
LPPQSVADSAFFALPPDTRMGNVLIQSPDKMRVPAEATHKSELE